MLSLSPQCTSVAGAGDVSSLSKEKAMCFLPKQNEQDLERLWILYPWKLLGLFQVQDLSFLACRSLQTLTAYKICNLIVCNLQSAIMLWIISCFMNYSYN